MVVLVVPSRVCPNWIDKGVLDLVDTFTRSDICRLTNLNACLQPYDRIFENMGTREAWS